MTAPYLVEHFLKLSYVHRNTLKGICLNLGLKNLYTVSSDLTEKLRGRELDGYEALYEKVSEQYKITVNALKSVE